jgi:hypothetical protein
VDDGRFQVCMLGLEVLFPMTLCPPAPLCTGLVVEIDTERLVCMVTIPHLRAHVVLKEQEKLVKALANDGFCGKEHLVGAGMQHRNEPASSGKDVWIIFTLDGLGPKRSGDL